MSHTCLIVITAESLLKVESFEKLHIVKLAG